MSTLNTTNITNGTDSITVEGAVKGSAKAWVNFNGTGVVAIRASFNVSSITDNAVGNYTVNFTTAMPDANYTAAGTLGLSGTVVILRVVPGSETTSSCDFLSNAVSTTATDATCVNIAIFR